MDREKVINGIKCLLSEQKCDFQNCPYWDFDKCIDAVLSDALAMLKEQEAETVESIQIDRSDKWGTDLTGYCPSCKRPLKSRFNQRFCGECGQAVKWE